MKKTVIILIIALLIVSFYFMPREVRSVDDSDIEAGVLPSSFWYWMDIYSEELRYVFQPGIEGKVELLRQMARERVAEIKDLNEQGITKYTDDLTHRQDAALEKIRLLEKKLATEKEAEAKILKVESASPTVVKKDPWRQTPEEVNSGVKDWFAGLKAKLFGGEEQAPATKTK